jgi:prepilin-type N-terminal cleavage/methylation domain-containing protein
MNRRRRGFTLVELLAVIASLSVLLGFSAAIIQGLLRVERKERAHVTEAATFSLFTREFKREAHRSARLVTQADTKTPAIELVFERSDGTRATYRAVEDGVEFSVKDGETTARNERFAMAIYGRPEFEISQVEGRTLVSVTFPNPATASKREKAPSLRVEAIVARDQTPADEVAKP